MDFDLDFAWGSTPYFLEFESCPIKLFASSKVSEEVNIDEVMIYGDELWSKICRYKGSTIPFT